MSRTFILAAGLALCSALPAAAFDPAQMSGAEKSAFDAAVRAYLLENPEVIMEAVAVLQQREMDAQLSNDQALAQSYLEDIQNDGYSWVGGNPEGDITIVEFTDYRCGYCRKAFEEVEELVKADGNIRIILKEFPILGEGSENSSKFAIAVKSLYGDETYKSVHDALIQMRADATLDNLRALADTLGLDGETISQKMESFEVADIIGRNRALGEKLAISGTPTFVFNDTLVRGYEPLQAMQARVAALREKS